MSMTNATDTPSGDEWNETSFCRQADTTTSGESTMSRYRLIVEVYLVGTLCVAGWIGNALSVVVLRRDMHRYKQGTTNWLLQTLAIVDTAFLVTCVLIQPLKAIHIRGGSTWFYRMYPYIEPYSWALASIAQTTTVWIVLLVTVDRYFAVCLPMKVRSVISSTQRIGNIDKTMKHNSVKSFIRLKTQCMKVTRTQTQQTSSSATAERPREA